LKAVGNLQIFHNQNLSPEEVIDSAKNADVLITGPESTGDLTEEILSKLINLKLIALLTLGTDWVNLDYARSRGIKVSNIGASTAESVAEHTWAMILSLAKRVSEFDRATRIDGDYDFAHFKGVEVYGKTLGVIGLGNIGKRVAEIGKAFSMRLLGINKSGKAVDGIEIVAKEKLFRESDVIAVCLPSDTSTTNYVSYDEIHMMKHNSVLVNCAREKIVNKDAVIEGIKQGKLFGYGVETNIMQEVPRNDPYYDCPQIIVTPHNAFNTAEADIRSYEVVVDNVLQFIEGHPTNAVI